MTEPSIQAQLEELISKLDIESKIKDGAENLLQVFDINLKSGKEELKKQVESELHAANAKIAALSRQIEQLQTSQGRPSTSSFLSSPQPRYRPLSPAPLLPAHSDSALGLQPGVEEEGDALSSFSRTAGPSTYGHAEHTGLGSAFGSEFGQGGLGLRGLEPDFRHRQPQYEGVSLVDDTEAVQVQESETDDVKAAREQAASLIQVLQSLTTPDARPESSEGEQKVPVAKHDSISSLQTATSPKKNVPTPSAASTARLAQRSRVAALAAAGRTESAHMRTPSHASGLGNLGKRRIETMARLVAVLKRDMRARYEMPLDDLADSVVPCLSDHAGKEVRAACYRLLRHALVRPPWPLVSRCRSRGLDMYLTRTFLRDHRFEVEKEQALKLVRAVLENGAAAGGSSADGDGQREELISVGVIRALVAISESSEDNLRPLCLETLAETAILDIDLLIRGGGLRPVLQALADGPYEFAPSLAQALLYIVDMPHTREYLRPGFDLEIALSNLTDASAQKGISYEESLRATARVVSVMLRSWSGLLYLCMDGKQAIASLVQALRINPKEVREIILDMFFELFNVNSPAWQDEILGGLQLNTLRKEKKVPDANKEAQPAKPPKAEQSEHGGGRLNLVDHYLSLLLVVFIEAGLIDALVHVLEHSPENHGRKATLLIGQILHVSNRVLPTSYGVQVHSLPHLFALASKFQSGENRQAATSALSSIDGLNRRLTRLDPQPTARSTRKERSPSTKETMRRGQRQVEKAKIRLGMQIDDNTFRNLLIETQVLSTKDHTKWNFDTLVELLEGPLMNPRRLEEAMRGTKFLRRLLSFFHPFAYRFSSIKKIKANERYVRLGCTMLTMLLSSADGIRFLAEDKLLRQIGDCLMQLDPLAGPPVAKPLMSKSRLEETLTSGYFDMIGTLTNSAEGIRLMERFKMFTTLYHLSELRSRDDLIKAVIENVDYSIDGHPRVVLSKALTSTYKHVRLFATKQLAELIRRKAPEASEWMIWLLLTQLYDPSFEVREMAVRMVEEACASMDVLEMVVAMRPTLDHLGDMGHPLLLKFLSTSVGFRYLWQGEYIDREMDDWFNERNHRYVVQLEIYLARTLAIDRARDDPELGKEFDGTVPPHFYGELAKTDEGCQVLEEKGHFAEFAHFIRQHGMECRDVELISKLKSVLWTVGNIGSTKGGLPFLEAEDVVSNIVEIAENSHVMSVRGTCFFVMGLISATQQGAELLQDYGWQSACTPLGAPLGLCIPVDVSRFVEMPTWTPKSASSLSYLDLAEPEGVIEREIILAISNLGNSILANNASRTLARLKARHRQHFADVTLFVRAIELLGDFYLRLPIRRYIWELFDIKLDQDVVSDLQAARNALVEKKRRRIADDELARRQQGQGGSGSGSSRFRTLPLTAARRRSGRRAANANGRTGAGGAGLKGAPFGGGRGLADNEIVTEDEMDSDVEGGGVGPPTEDDEGLDADADADADMDLDGDLDPEMDGDGDGDGDGAAADDSDEYLSLPHHPTGAGGAGGRGGASATPGVYFEPRKRVLGFGFAGSGPAREREGTGNADADAGAGAGAGAGASQAQAVPA